MRHRPGIILAACLALALAGGASAGIAIPGFDVLTFAAGTPLNGAEIKLNTEY